MSKEVALFCAALVCTINIAKTSEGQLPPIHEAAKRGDVITIKQQLGEGVPVDLPCKQGSTGAWQDTTPLMWAASRARVAAVKYLIKSKADVNACNVHGTTPLMAAAGAITTIGGDPLTCLRLLIDAGAKLETKDHHDRTALFYACGDTRNWNFDTPPNEVLPPAARRADPFRLLRPYVVGSIVGQQIESERWVKARRGDAARVKALLEAGAKVNLDSDWGSLLASAATSSDVARIRLLLDAKADLERGTKTGNWNALKVAAMHNTAEVFEVLLEAGSDIQGGTLLRAAAARKDAAKKVEVLLARGANPNEHHNNGTTALICALRQPDRTDAASVLLAAGANPKVQSRSEESVWGLAAENGSGALLKRLLMVGFESTKRATRKPHAPVLVLAAASKHEPTAKVEMLLEAGADIHAVDDNGRCALLAASMVGNMDTVIELVKRGADVNTTDSSRGTALRYVANRGADETFMCEQTGGRAAQVLIEHGARIDGGAGRLAAIMAAKCDHWEFLEVLVEARKPQKASKE